MDTHLSDYMTPRNGRNVRTLCGAWVEAGDLGRADTITCPDCRALNPDDDRTAEEVFGPPPTSPVPFKEFNPTQGYKPKER